MAFCFMEGNEAISWAAYHAGCRFFAGYPITPATTVFNNMLKLLPPNGGICMQGEDEIASIGFCLGASMAGMKVMTATSGPGISLYSEQISFAIGSEIPIVIVNVQRLGPSTGSATKGADGDIQFMRWGNSGGLPVIVLAPSDIRDCYLLTRHAFNLAERFRCPVFIAANKEVAMTRETIDLERLQPPEIINRKYAPDDRPLTPFDATVDDPTPAFLPIGSQQLVRQTSSTHGADGYITTDSEQIAANQERLKLKLERYIDQFTFYEEITSPGADTLLITYGVTARAAKVAVNKLWKEGCPVSLLILKTLWPTPDRLIQTKSAAFKKIVVVEMNKGQYEREIKRMLGAKPVKFWGSMNGDLITPAQIKEVLQDA